MAPVRRHAFFSFGPLNCDERTGSTTPYLIHKGLCTGCAVDAAIGTLLASSGSASCSCARPSRTPAGSRPGTWCRSGTAASSPRPRCTPTATDSRPERTDLRSKEPFNANHLKFRSSAVQLTASTVEFHFNQAIGQARALVQFTRIRVVVAVGAAHRPRSDAVSITRAPGRDINNKRLSETRAGVPCAYLAAIKRQQEAN